MYNRLSFTGGFVELKNFPVITEAVSVTINFVNLKSLFNI
jgi:hypothetical protein